MNKPTGIISHVKNSDYVQAITRIALESQSDIVNDSLNGEGFKEQRLYDLINKLNNTRYEKPVFHKCKSCGYEVVDYQLDENRVCTDCRKVDDK